MISNENKIAVISGGSKGIGRATVEKFLNEGFVVYTTSRNGISDLKNPKLLSHQVDMSKKTDVLAFAKQVKSEVNKIDVLVNNVGIFIPGSLMGEDDGVFEKQINTNLSSTYHLTRALFPLIQASDYGYIFCICSTASITPYINGGSYCISKYAQLGFTKVLREELKSDNIRVTAVLPGATETASWEQSDLPSERFIQPESVAQLIWDAYKLPTNTVVEEILVRPMDGDIT